MQVDFYVLSQTTEAAMHQFVCRLTEKAYQQGLGVHVMMRDERTLEQLDEQLWTFRDGSFVPHERLGKSVDNAPVTLSLGNEHRASADIAIVVDCELLDDLNQCKRIAEVVGGDEEARARSRERFRYYRDQGIEPTTHKIAS